MRIEWWILLLVNTVATGILFFIPKNKIRLAIVAFLFKQLITFLIGLVVVELGLLEYPVRLFASINRTSFTFEYYAFPVVCAAFNVWYPIGRSTLIQLSYYAGYSSVITIIEIIIEKYTDLIKYIHWDWYTTWITICLSFLISRLFCIWFFAKGTN
ncbi:CBO0543 family protein [Cytobacillus massiliigabonensis]|uniref:CBO0543 family protein n=1 Tax=Cytobacillus massiliigabonensis TaxID=1871011 RepID=UPI000C816502|nr:CBO0543 family protein [Cytobacillus massiliigabonensis]